MSNQCPVSVSVPRIAQQPAIKKLVRSEAEINPVFMYFFCARFSSLLYGANGAKRVDYGKLMVLHSKMASHDICPQQLPIKVYRISVDEPWKYHQQC